MKCVITATLTCSIVCCIDVILELNMAETICSASLLSCMEHEIVHGEGFSCSVYLRQGRAVPA